MAIARTAFPASDSKAKVLPDPVQGVATALLQHAYSHAALMLGAGARTAQQSADQLDAPLDQIAKSIDFRRKSDDTALLVIGTDAGGPVNRQAVPKANPSTSSRRLTL